MLEEVKIVVGHDVFSIWLKEGAMVGWNLDQLWSYQQFFEEYGDNTMNKDLDGDFEEDLCDEGVEEEGSHYI